MKVLFKKSLVAIASVVALSITPWFCHAASLTPASVITAINQERQRLNLPELVTDQRLVQASKEKIADMAANHYIDHVNPAGDMPWDYLDAAGYPYRTAGENIGKDFFNTSAVMNAWMASDTHHANIVSIAFKDIGAAIGTVDGHMVITTMFGATTLTPSVAGISINEPQKNTNDSIPKSQTIIHAVAHHETSPIYSSFFYATYYILLGFTVVTIIVVQFLK